MKLPNWIKQMFAPRVTIERHYGPPLSQQQREAFDNAFKAMDEAFKQLDKVFRP